MEWISLLAFRIGNPSLAGALEKSYQDVIMFNFHSLSDLCYKIWISLLGSESPAVLFI
jgi:hypothetical protein